MPLNSPRSGVTILLVSSIILPFLTASATASTFNPSPQLLLGIPPPEPDLAADSSLPGGRIQRPLAEIHHKPLDNVMDVDSHIRHPLRRHDSRSRSRSYAKRSAAPTDISHGPSEKRLRKERRKHHTSILPDDTQDSSSDPLYSGGFLPVSLTATSDLPNLPTTISTSDPGPTSTGMSRARLTRAQPVVSTSTSTLSTETATSSSDSSSPTAAASAAALSAASNGTLVHPDGSSSSASTDSASCSGFSSIYKTCFPYRPATIAGTAVAGMGVCMLLIAIIRCCVRSSEKNKEQGSYPGAWVGDGSEHGKTNDNLTTLPPTLGKRGRSDTSDLADMKELGKLGSGSGRRLESPYSANTRGSGAARQNGTVAGHSVVSSMSSYSTHTIDESIKSGTRSSRTAASPLPTVPYYYQPRIDRPPADCLLPDRPARAQMKSAGQGSGNKDGTAPKSRIRRAPDTKYVDMVSTKAYWDRELKRRQMELEGA